MRRIVYLLVLWLISASTFPLSAQGQDDWLMKAHDVRRTGQSESFGILSVDSSRTWAIAAPAAFQINVGATVVGDLAVYGAWGLLFKDEQERDVRYWDKANGKLYPVNTQTGVFAWDGPTGLDKVNRCYDLPERDYTGTDLFFCGLFNNYHVTFYNGTVEGQAAYSPSTDLLYVGRGDGKLYAVSRTTGEIAWRFTTFNPTFASDPDGGGEIVTAPLPDRRGAVNLR